MTAPQTTPEGYCRVMDHQHGDTETAIPPAAAAAERRRWWLERNWQMAAAVFVASVAVAVTTEMVVLEGED